MRPQRASRDTSKLGENVQQAPVWRISSAVSAPIFSIREGLKVEAMLMFVG